ncbi:LysR family transcriptional regulator [Variovorax sp. J22R115]|uniref:LysR family transcriptional regulator n=1 Tax=Variovorax sp. J22R115 TaxID=3053509 RepID=UPI0025782335|nr:LysR family transcriptional regulator [Variovorax sp. J22R115]MDM0048103.1 LysR family transcriptional regulator [Variovorax sp. J22R115]
MHQERNANGELSFHLLKCLVALVRHSHVSRAAEAISISQPAMSRAIGQLRTVTGDPILVKGGSGLIPTAKALQLRDFAERILEEMDELLGNAVAFDPRVTRYLFRMVATDYLECLFVDHLVQHLGTEYPGISISVRHPVHPSQFNKVLEAGDVDFCVGILPPSLRELRHRLLFRDRIVCIARAGHWAMGKTLTPAEFAGLEHVVIMPNTVNCFGESVDQALAAQGLQRQRRYVTPNYLTAPHLLEKSDMVALLPLSLASRFRDRFGLAELALPVVVPAFDVYISWHDRTHRHAAHIWFRDQVMQSLELKVKDGHSLRA